MYRIVKESYEHFLSDFTREQQESYRYRVALPFALLFDLDTYAEEGAIRSEQFLKIQDFLWRLEQMTTTHPQYKVFLRELASRGIVGTNTNVLTDEEFGEQRNLLEMFLNLSYWDL
jgi:hypothetical protein